MKQLLFSLIILFALINFSFAQQRHIARGAAEGELYMNVTWYANYGFWGDTLYAAMLHITENGKKVEINHSMQCQSPDALTGDALPMQIGYSMADATPGVLYNADWFMAYADDNQPYIYDRLWFSNDYGKTWELRDKPEYRSRYYVSNFEGLLYRGGGGGI
jgi:hypothetical protein